MEIKFIVPGNPIAKGRPRFARRGKFVATYSPAKTVNYEGLVAYAASMAMNGNDLIKGAVSVEIDICLQIPESWSKKKKLSAVNGDLAAIKKPDIDNIFKAISDAMNGVVFVDDSQVTELSIVKKYAETPCVLVIVKEINPS